MPADLMELLKGMTVSSYRNGFLTFLPPEDFQDIFAYWNLPTFSCYPFLKSAFGMIIFLHDGQYKLLDPIANEIILLAESGDLDFLLNFMLCDRTGLENTFHIHLYEQVFPIIEAPEPDECFAFLPAVRLGGILDASNIQKTKLKPQLAILSQL